MHIVLDLDETLVSVTTSRPGQHNFDFKIGNVTYYVRKRPHLDLFLGYIFKNFETVNVWTAATRPYAETVLRGIMTEQQIRSLTYVLAREDLAINYNGTITKPLAKMYRGISGGPPLDPDQTLMIDDRISVVENNQGNAIIVPPWTGNNGDIALAQLVVILDGIFKHCNKLAFSQYQRYFKLQDLVGGGSMTPP